MIIIGLLLFILIIILFYVFYHFSRHFFQKREQAIDNLVKPLKESLEKFDQTIQAIEQSRAGAYAGLSEQVKSLLHAQLQLRTETSHLANALRKPHVRGRWGEIQLQRVVELAGMLEHCDFYQQKTSDNITESSMARPDVIIRLPGQKNIIVDAKVPLSSFLDALEDTDEVQQRQKLHVHAKHLREHVKKLSQKNYWSQFASSLEFVVLFLPSETFFSAALEVDPSLLEKTAEQGVIIATPMTLIALLKTIAYGWRQENLAKDAQYISELGKELAKRLNDMQDHFSHVGDKLAKAVDSYNKTIGTLESRVLVTARKFQALNHMQESEGLKSIDLSLKKGISK